MTTTRETRGPGERFNNKNAGITQHAAVFRGDATAEVRHEIKRNIEASEGQTVAEVATLWSGSILDVKQLGSGKGEQRQFTVGEAPECDTWLQPELIGASRFHLVTTDGGDVVAHFPPSSRVTLERPEITIDGTDILLEEGLAKPDGKGGAKLVLREGWVAEIVMGEITFRVRRTEPGVSSADMVPRWTGARSLDRWVLSGARPLPGARIRQSPLLLIRFPLILDKDDCFTEYLVAPLEIAPPQYS